MNYFHFGWDGFDPVLRDSVSQVFNLLGCKKEHLDNLRKKLWSQRV